MLLTIEDCKQKASMILMTNYTQKIFNKQIDELAEIIFEHQTSPEMQKYINIYMHIFGIKTWKIKWDYGDIYN